MRKLYIFGMFLLFYAATTLASSFEIALIHNTPDQKVAAKILKVIYKKLDIAVVFVELPGKRALAESSKGALDGEAQRIYEIGEVYPSLVRVPTSFISWEIAAFSKKHDFKITGWSSLKNYNISIVRGMKYAEMGLKEAGVEKVGILSDVGEMMSMLHLDFIDFAISSRFNGMVQLKRLGLDSIRPNSPNLSKLKLYHYLHIKHIELIPRIDAVIKSMKNAGELTILKEKFQRELLNEAEHHHRLTKG